MYRMFKMLGVFISYTWEVTLALAFMLGFAIGMADLLGKLAGLDK